MKKSYSVLLLLVIILLAAFLFFKKFFQSSDINSAQNQVPNLMQNLKTDDMMQNIQDNQNNQNTNNFQSPLDRAKERVAKKPFGIYITPKNSPIQPEKFQGYHTGTDFEIFPEELDIDVSVRAVCKGKLLQKEYVNGYGGVAIESCQLNNQPITVIYGHLNLASINVTAGNDINIRDILGNLGKAYSTETNGERKHLHLGFHKGNAVDVLGYVSSQSQLSGWIDPCLYICT